MNFFPLLIMVSLLSIPFLAIYLMLKLWIKHREKISDAIRENTELKKEIEALEEVKEAIKPKSAWISANENILPDEKCLVIYLEPSFGNFNLDITIAFFDNPSNYENPTDGKGWVDWITEMPLMVTHFMDLPKVDFELTENSQEEFLAKFKIERGIVPNEAIKQAV